MTFRCRASAALAHALLALALTGCSSISHKPMPAAAPDPAGVRHIAIFLDGTANDEGSDTNVKRLHSLVTLQDRPDIAALYVHGVGTDADVTGMATGSGINQRAQIAYEFILNHYRAKAPGLPPDRIYIFGFSRGAYAARILTSMLYHAGLPQPAERGRCRLTSTERAGVVHNAVAPIEAHYSPIDESRRRSGVQKKLATLNSDPVLLPAARGCFATPSPAVEVEVLGLWDTVEALGVANWGSRLLSKTGLSQHLEDVDVPNIRYGDKLCNVQHALHAVSIDDNRAWIFTPLLLTRRHHFDGCEGGRAAMLDDSGRLRTGRLREVWFAGAHSDVGGGYGDSALSGVSLNWMIGELNRIAQATPAMSQGSLHPGLLPPGARVREDVFGSSHNPSTGFFDLTYHEIHRDLYRYAHARKAGGPPSPVDVFSGRVCVHPSVFERRNRVPLQSHENPQLALKQSGTVSLRHDRIASNLPWLWPVESSDSAATMRLHVDSYPHCANF